MFARIVLVDLLRITLAAHNSLDVPFRHCDIFVWHWSFAQ